METDLQIRGKVAQFGRGAMEQVAGRMLERFADNVEKAIAGETPEAADDEAGALTLPLPRDPERRLVGARRRRGRLRRRLPDRPVAVKAADFDYYRVDSLEDALDRLGELGEDAKVLAGGQSLVPMMNFRLARPAALVDITRVEELRGIERHNGELRIRAATTHAEVEHAAELEGGYEVCAPPPQWVGHEPIRSRGTFGGSLAHADPTAEWCLIAVALGAVIEIAGPRGEREVPAEEFLLGYFTTALEPDEIVTAVRFPAPCRRAAIQEFARRHGDFALVAVAVALPDDGEPRVVLGGVGDVPVRAREAERLLADGEPLRRRPRRAAAAEIDPASTCTPAPTTGGGWRPRWSAARSRRRRIAPDGRAEPSRAVGGRWVGRSVARVEDRRHLTGDASFVDDIRTAGVLHVAFARSPHGGGADRGHRHRRGGAGARRARRADRRRPRRPRAAHAACSTGRSSCAVEFPMLAAERVRHAGEPVAMVVADSPHAAEDAAELIVVDYEPDDAVGSIEAALEADAPRVHDQLDSNVLLDVPFADDPEIDDVLAGAELVVEAEFSSGRLTAVPLEGRACLAEWERGGQRARPAHLDAGPAHRPHHGGGRARRRRAPRARRRAGRRRRLRPEVRRRARGGARVRRRARRRRAGQVGRGPRREPAGRLPGPRAALRRPRRRSTPRARCSPSTPTSCATSAPTRRTRSPAASSR